MSKCTKPNCDCLKRAEIANGGPLKDGYQCLYNTYAVNAAKKKQAIPSLPETEREPSFYCVKPSDIPCHKQCDSCKKVSPVDQPVPDEVKDADKNKAFVELVRDMRPEQALRVAAYIDQEILSLRTHLSSTEAERDAIKKAFDLQAEELKKLRNQ